MGTVADPGVIAIDTSEAVVTDTVAALLLPPKLAVIADQPELTPVTIPLAGVTVAMPDVAVVQLAV